MKSINRRKRRGVSSVEFAMVSPVVFLIVFSIIELSRLMLIDGSMTTAILAGMRSASLEDSTPAEAESLIRSELGMIGVSDVTIQFDPPTFELPNLNQNIQIVVPLNSTNGFIGSHLVKPNSKFNKSISFERE